MANKTFSLHQSLIEGIPVGKFPTGNSFNVELNGSFLCKTLKICPLTIAGKIVNTLNVLPFYFG